MELSEQARKARNEYQRRYRRANPDKIRRYNMQYWERKAKQELIDPALQAKQLYQQGYTQREISEALGVSLGTVNKLLNKD